MKKAHRPMFWKPLLLPLLWLTLTSSPAAAQTPANAPAVPFKHGEELTYKIYYNWNFVWLAAGEVTFKIWDEGAQFHYQAFGKTYSSYEWFFVVHDQYESWVDRTTLLPNYSERSVNEGDYHIFEKISFNQASKKMTVWRAPKRGDTETKTEHAVKAKVYDVLSTLYFLRTVDFPAKGTGGSESFSVFMDQEEFPLKMKYLGRFPRKSVHGMGKYKTLKFEPEVIAGNVFNENTKMTVWVGDDANRIPVLIESPVSVGSVKVVLKSYKNLSYPFEAKVD